MPFISYNDLNPAAPSSACKDLLELWNRLAISSGQIDPCCCCPPWNLAFHATFNPDRRIFFLAGDNSLLLFYEYAQGNNIFFSPLEDGWLFGKPLLGPLAPRLLDEALSIWIRQYRGRLPIIILSGLNKADILATSLLCRFSSRFHFYGYHEFAECCASLTDGLDGWLSRRSANHRAKLRKALKRGHAAGLYYERSRPATPLQATEVYERMLAIERQSWKGINNCGMAEFPSVAFYRNLLLRQSSTASAFVIFARLEERDVGFIYGNVNGPYYRGQQFSYVQDLAPLSIGNLMQWEKIRWLVEEGVQRYDMGPITGPKMEYKRHWTEQVFQSESWIMRPAF